MVGGPWMYERGGREHVVRIGRVGRRVVVACLFATAAASMLGGVARAVTTVGYHETHTQTIDAGNSLDAVSCVPATTTCVAADSSGDAFYATDASVTSAATWNSWSGPGLGPSEAVECPAISLCVLAAGEVSGGGGDVYRASSLGGTFLSSFKPANGAGALSCPSTSFCVSAHEGGGFIRYSTNPSGIIWMAMSIGTGAMKGVFCLSSSFCAVVDDSGHIHVATTEEHIEESGGVGWTSTDIDGSAALRDVACSSTTSCVAVDGTARVINLTIGPD